MSGIVLAYDGSTHADWVGRYAIRLARASGEGLEVVHVDDGALGRAELESRVAHLHEVASASGVDLCLRHMDGTEATAARVLDGSVPVDSGSLLVVGLRARQSGRGLLRGTVAELLLRSGHHDVLAIRVVSPSLLGHARHVLFAISQHPRSASRTAPVLRLFAPELTRLSLLTVMSPWLGALARPTGADLRLLRARGLDTLQQAEAGVRAALVPFEVPCDPHVSVSSDWPGEITRHAVRARAELVLLGSTERTLRQRMGLGNPLERVLLDAVCDVAIFGRARAASS